MKLENDFGQDPIGKLVLRIAIPSMLAQFVSVLYSVVDRMYIGNIPEVGSLALAGAGVCGPIVTLIAAFAFWIGIGGTPLLSISMGEGSMDRAKKILSNSFLLITSFSVIITAAALLTRRPVLMLFGASDKMLPYALDYYTIYVCGTIFALLSTGMNQFIIAQGFAKKGMQSVLLGAVLNIALDPIFIFGLKLGVAGAAIATVLSQLGSCIFVLVFLFGPKPPIRITFQGYDLSIVRRILLMGLPPFFIYATEGIIVIAMNASLQHFGGPVQGDLLVAAATISQSFLLLVIMPLGGITAGTGSILGYNFGAGRPDRILRAMKHIAFLALLYTSILFLVARLLAAPFTRIFTPDPAVSAVAVQAIHSASLFIIPLALQYVVVDGFTGMGVMRLALPLSMFRKITYCACLVVLPLLWGAPAVFLAEAVSDLSACVLSCAVFLCKRRWLVKQALHHGPAQQEEQAVNGRLIHA